MIHAFTKKKKKFLKSKKYLGFLQWEWILGAKNGRQVPIRRYSNIVMKNSVDLEVDVSRRGGNVGICMYISQCIWT